jgi:D-alanine-D-alanine ligase
MAISKLRVAVLRGGTDSSYESSLRSGHDVLTLLRGSADTFDPLDIFISKDGVWHLRGLPVEPHMSLKHADVAWSALHDDTSAKQLLESLRVRYVGSGIVPTALATNIVHMRKAYARENLPTLRFELLNEDTYKDEQALEIFRTFVFPVAVCTHEKNSPFGTVVVRSYLELEEAIKSAFLHAKKIVVEEFIKGKVAICSIIENARNERLHALLPSELRGSDIRCPGAFSIEEKRAIEDLARRAHKALGLRHYSDSRFLITPKGKTYILHTDTTPDISPDSILSKSLKATGWKHKDFVEHLLSEARK